MSREEMVKRSWKPYMIIEYKDNGMEHSVECFLCAIDFDAELLTLIPINEFYSQDEFKANLKYCEVSKRLKVATINGKKQVDKNDNLIKSKIFK